MNNISNNPSKGRFAGGNIRDGVGKVQDERKAVRDLSLEGRQSFLLDPIPLVHIAVTIFNQQFIARVDGVDYRNGAIWSNPDVDFVIVDVFIHSTEAGHRV